jgi:hypothetical protein
LVRKKKSKEKREEKTKKEKEKQRKSNLISESLQVKKMCNIRWANPRHNSTSKFFHILNIFFTLRFAAT